MLKELILFEWRFQTRQIAFVAAVLIFTFVGFLTGGQNPGGANVYTNSPYNLAHIMATMSMGSIFVATVFCVAAIMRDKENKMDQIIHATQVGKFAFLGGRFLGSTAAAFAATAAIILGLLLSSIITLGNAESFGPFHVSHYLWPVLIFTLPNVVLCASLLFPVAALTRSSRATYAAGILIYFLYWGTSAVMNSPLLAQSTVNDPENLALGALFDPFGIVAFFEQTHYWTISERNTQLLSLQGPLLWNRIAWSLLSVLLLAMTCAVYQFRIRSPRIKKEIGDDASAPAPGRVQTRIFTGARAQWSAFFNLCKLEMKGLFSSLIFWSLQLLWLALAVLELSSRIGDGNNGSASYPATGLLLQGLAESLGNFTTVFLVYFCADLMWRDKLCGASKIMDASPVSNKAFFASKLVAMTGLVAITLIMGFLAALIVQIASGWYDFQWGLYLSFFFIYGIPIVLTGVLLLLAQTLIPGKYLGILMSIVLLIVLKGSALTGISHQMLRYGNAPPVLYSEMNGFGSTLAAWGWFMGYWSAFAGILAMAGYLLWRRGSETGIKRRLTGLFTSLGGGEKLVMTGLAVAFVIVGGFIFYNTNIIHSYETRDEVNDWKANYEKKYGSFEERPAPAVTSARLNVDLFPDQRRALIGGVYQISNLSEQPLEQALMRLKSDVSVLSIEMDGATLMQTDAEYGCYLFQLDQPLEPGQSLEIRINSAMDNPGFSNGRPDMAIAANGTFLQFARFAPAFGYREALELKDNGERRKRGLPDYEAVVVEDFHGIHEKAKQGRLDYEAVVSTPKDQVALTCGVLERQWEDEGRAFYHYKSSRPISGHIGIMSAKYQVLNEEYQGIALSVYHHPDHQRNVAYMIDATRASMDYFTENFGPYPFSHFRIFEIPGLWRRFSGVGFAGTVGFLETRGFLADRRDPNDKDQVLRRTAHELAHQWWGHLIDAADMPGASFLIESFTKYSETMVLEQVYGKKEARKFMLYEMDRYLRGRTGERYEEAPLYQGESAYLVYSKGAVIMYALRDLVGEQTLNQAMRNLLDRRDVTTLDFLDELYSLTPSEQHPIIDLWMKKRVIYDLQTNTATYEIMADGRFKLHLTVSARLMENDGKGLETPLAVDQRFPIGVYDEQGEAIYLEKHHITQETTQLTLILDRKPARAGIDPNTLMIDRNRFNNLKETKPVDQVAVEKAGLDMLR